MTVKLRTGARAAQAHRLSSHHPAAVGLEHLAREVVGFFGGEEDRAVGDVVHLPEVARLAATPARLWATRWALLHTEYAGPIPYATA